MTILVLVLVLLAASWFLLPMPWARLLLATGRRLAGLSPGWIEVDGRKWHYLRGGKGPVLLALHGFGADGDNWLKVAPALTRKFSVIAPDLPGFGSSNGDGLDFDIDSQVGRLNSFVEALGITPVYIAGNSMGGWITATYAARYPGEIRAIWLLAPLGVKDSKTSHMLGSISRNQKSPFQVDNRAQFRKLVLEEMFFRLPWIPYPLQAYYTESAKTLGKVAAERFRQILTESEPLELIAASIHIPVLLQWGVEDHAVDVSGAAPLQEAFSNITVQLQADTGHVPMLETPAESARFFLEFIEKHQLA